MIISAFQSVGKSTLADNDKNYVDFESSNFNKADPNWFIDYCEQAIKLADSGKVVFVSSHKPVRDYLKEHYQDYYMIMFAPELKQQVLDRLEQRYKLTGLEKDKRALERAQSSFDSISAEIKQDEANGLKVYYIKDMEYNLKDIIKKLNAEHNLAEDKKPLTVDLKDIANDPEFLKFAKMFGANTADWVDGSPSKKAEDFVKNKAIELGYYDVGDFLNDEEIYDKECTEYINSLNLVGEDKAAFDDWVWHLKNYF